MLAAKRLSSLAYYCIFIISLRPAVMTYSPLKIESTDRHYQMVIYNKTALFFVPKPRIQYNHS